MTTRPGVSVTQRVTSPPSTLPTDTGVWHVVGIAEKGSTTPTVIASLSDFQAIFGSRVSYSILYDAIDAYFREGGQRAVVSRVVGPSPVNATKNLLDGVSAICLVATSVGPGTYYNTIKIGVRAGSVGGTFVIYIVDADSVEVETSGDLSDIPAAVLWGEYSGYVRLAAGSSVLDPAVLAAAVLASGDDDHANIVDAQWLTALNNIVPEYGTGQVSAPGQITTARRTQLLAHARANRRVAILDGTDTATSATLSADAAACRAGDQQYGAMFAPWVKAPGVVAGTTRTIPPCAFVAGVISRNDGAGYGPGTPAANDLGILRYAIGISQVAWTDSVRTTLNSGGVNVIRLMLDKLKVYGWRSTATPVTDTNWVWLSGVRTFMAVSAACASVAESFAFAQIDGRGHTISEFNGALRGACMRFYNNGDLYGDTADDAFRVDTGGSINTPTTLAANELHGVVSIRTSPGAEFVQVEVVKRPITEGVAS